MQIFTAQKSLSNGQTSIAVSINLRPKMNAWKSFMKKEKALIIFWKAQTDGKALTKKPRLKF